MSKCDQATPEICSDLLYRYEIIGNDANGIVLVYSLDDTSVAKGITIDDNRRLNWTPTINDVRKKSD